MNKRSRRREKGDLPQIILFLASFRIVVSIIFTQGRLVKKRLEVIGRSVKCKLFGSLSPPSPVEEIANGGCGKKVCMQGGREKGSSESSQNKTQLGSLFGSHDCGEIENCRSSCSYIHSYYWWRAGWRCESFATERILDLVQRTTRPGENSKSAIRIRMGMVARLHRVRHLSSPCHKHLIHIMLQSASPILMNNHYQMSSRFRVIQVWLHFDFETECCLVIHVRQTEFIWAWSCSAERRRRSKQKTKK